MARVLFDHIHLQGSAGFIARTQAALACLRSANCSSEVWGLLALIREGKRFEVDASNDLPVIEVSLTTWNSATIWYASGIAHEGFHIKLYREAKAQNNGHEPETNTWAGAEAERKCLRFQMRVLEDLKAEERFLDYIRELMKSPEYGGDAISSEDYKPSPFPGMDPYLEECGRWPCFRQTLLKCVCELLQRQIEAHYETAVCERRYGAQGEVREEYLEIRRRNQESLVTVLDFVSPDNKTTSAGRDAYLNTRRGAKKAGANLVEIDLVLQGQPTIDYCRDGLPRWNYAVTVTPAAPPDRHEIYTSTLEKRLPRFKLPLAAPDRDAVLDLQAAFARCYDQLELTKLIDYQRDPALLLTEEDRGCIDTLLRQMGVRKGNPPHERIAALAYSIWQREGCPTGRHQQHWFMAVEELKQRAQSPK